MKIKSLFFVLLILLLISCSGNRRDFITFPYSQWTMGTTGHDITWRYLEGFEYNNSFIKAPSPGEWEAWYKTISVYRDTVRKKIGKAPPYLYIKHNGKQEPKIHFDKFAYQLKLMPGEIIEVTGETRTVEKAFTIYVDFDVKTKGEELSYVVRKRLIGMDSLEVPISGEWQSFSKTVRIPAFSIDSFSIVPILRIGLQDETAEEKQELFLKNIRLHVDPVNDRPEILARIENYIQKQAETSALVIGEEFSWTHANFVMGFVFTWDHSFYDPVKGEYLVDSYCSNMEKEFGGIQSVILWHSYPNIGIDEKNQFDFFHALPGGMGGLKQVVDDFHRNGVKVFLTYNPWDLDTRRPEHHDFVELANAIHETGADGIYLDTWKCSKGVISLFEVENSIRDEVSKFGIPVAFTTEILPEFKDLCGSDALTSSWGQEIEPYHYTDLSHQKWIMPQHKQYYIKRMEKDRKPILAHAWINGQGIQLWENIFGTMNLWNAQDRKFLRKMNEIWKNYGNFYLGDDWKPFIPLEAENVIASQWKKGETILTQLVDTLDSPSVVRMEVSNDPSSRYFDLWNGKEIYPVKEKGMMFLSFHVESFGCILQTKGENQNLSRLLEVQARETHTPLPVKDKYDRELSLKMPIPYNYRQAQNPDFNTGLIPVSGGEETFICKHIWREGRCYPDMNAAHNHDLVLSREDGAQRITHTHTEMLGDYAIMPRVVTNGQFKEFLNATAYEPRFPDNFLKHWNGSEVPSSIIDEPVIYVSLEDARAFAEWAGMRLPTEWEWQKAVMDLGDDFIFNEVFEWNESERFDGYNRFVTLRGGGSRWVLPSSWWYLPGAAYGKKAGGEQKYDSHVKYFLMYPGMDRASTIGFRCLKK